ncbi:MAG: hypothetical protein LBU60_00745 [Clostridiales bacterium]|jgi:hypothetical protein|nr:hypothetical protein [Clostridiales bacterium]
MIKIKVKRKRVIVVSVALMLMLPLAMGLVGCNTLKTVYTSGYFEYTVYKDKQSNENIASIVGFSESGKQQEVIDIPREIDGIEVYALGGSKGKPFGW